MEPYEIARLKEVLRAVRKRETENVRSLGVVVGVRGRGAVQIHWRLVVVVANGALIVSSRV